MRAPALIQAKVQANKLTIEPIKIMNPKKPTPADSAKPLISNALLLKAVDSPVNPISSIDDSLIECFYDGLIDLQIA
jgi:hypothetical protein